MSKKNNANPDFYYDRGRNHQGEGILQEQNREKLNESKKTEGNEGEPNFIPGEKPVGEKSGK
jgi:hypothetical protein